MEHLQKMYYTDFDSISNNITLYKCDCCNNELHIPYQKLQCSCGDEHLFNYMCIREKINCSKYCDSSVLKCIKPNCNGCIQQNNIYDYISNDNLIDLINKYFSDYVWLYESRCVNLYWIYNTNFSNITNNKYYDVYHNNKTCNINCDIYKRYLLSLHNISDYMLYNIFTYMNICEKCYKQHKQFIKIECLCNNKKKCTKKQCNGVCKKLQTFNIEYNDTSDLIVDFNDMTQKNKYNLNKRIIKKIHKNELINNLQIIQGISSLQRDKNS